MGRTGSVTGALVDRRSAALGRPFCVESRPNSAAFGPSAVKLRAECGPIPTKLWATSADIIQIQLSTAQISTNLGRVRGIPTKLARNRPSLADSGAQKCRGARPLQGRSPEAPCSCGVCSCGVFHLPLL